MTGTGDRALTRPLDVDAVVAAPTPEEMVRAVPLARLTCFPGLPVREDELSAMAVDASAG